MYLAVFLKGNVTDGLRKRMRRTLHEIVEKFGKVLIDWDGDVHKVEPIKENLAFLMGKSR